MRMEALLDPRWKQGGWKSKGGSSGEREREKEPGIAARIDPVSGTP